jgi:AcrR family transcriptional regulator
MLKAAESQLQKSPVSDISIRAVCEAVGVGLPVLYRLFGDKNGLISAVIDEVFERYLAQQRAQVSDDPVDDLYISWDSHVSFALNKPVVYLMAYAPSLVDVPSGVVEGQRLVLQRCVRCAEAGMLKTTPVEAAQALMAACLGVNLCLLTQPAAESDLDLSHCVRDAVIDGLVIDAGARAPDPKGGPLKVVALHMAALIREMPTPLTKPESTVMPQWIETISGVTCLGAAPRTRGRRWSR